ncbi:chemotaxis protein CheW [Kangiella sp. TOML190]|uniref:chemotaxis protein CheW n=1 Tax=Kangiella sp. TOML190 TaxID=2931351 RepID=UPI00203C8AD7|nr:chemotaxis protein CheW [Kangiella sp. TOML190]
MSKKKKVSEVFSFLIPMQQDHLLMPNEAVAEIVPFMNVSLFSGVEENKEWHIGNLAWRNMTIPVISLERVHGQQDIGDIRRSRIAVIYTLNGNQEVPYLALTVRGIPRVIPIDENNSAMENAKPKEKGISAWVTVGEQKALIPDMDALEELAKSVA